jgi:hypothetical protein
MARFGGVGTDREAHVSDEMWALSREPTLTGSERIVGKSYLTPPELEPDIALTEPQPWHRTPPAWMRLCTPLVIAQSGRIPLHWMAAYLRTFEPGQHVISDTLDVLWLGTIREHF